MDAIVGLGGAGCAVAESFKRYPQYKVYKIDSGLPEGEGVFSMPEQKTSEEYESSCPDMSDFFSDFSEGTNVTFILAGGGKIAGASLRILSQIRHCNLRLVYITPDIALMGGKKYILNRISFHVLQEYARSGLFDNISLVYNPSLEAVLGDLPVRGYYDALNDALVGTVHMVNVFSNTEPVFKNLAEAEEHHRICSYGVVNPENFEENLLFPLDNIREKVYYIGINKSSVEDGEFFKNLKSKMREKSQKENVKVSFQINETKYDEDYAYFIAFADEVQNENNLKKFLTQGQG